jgi:hypothetical protein
MYERFTDRARRVMQLANREAQRFNHEYIGTEHILLSLLRDEEGIAAAVLANVGLDVKEVLAEILKIPNRGNDIERGRSRGSAQVSIRQLSIQPAVEPPAICPKCGQAGVVRVLWHWVHLVGKNLEDVTAGRAILGSRVRG